MVGELGRTGSIQFFCLLCLPEPQSVDLLRPLCPHCRQLLAARRPRGIQAPAVGKALPVPHAAPLELAALGDDLVLPGAQRIDVRGLRAKPLDLSQLAFPAPPLLRSFAFQILRFVCFLPRPQSSPLDRPACLLLRRDLVLQISDECFVGLDLLLEKRDRLQHALQPVGLFGGHRLPNSRVRKVQVQSGRPLSATSLSSGVFSLCLVLLFFFHSQPSTLFIVSQRACSIPLVLFILQLFPHRFIVQLWLCPKVLCLLSPFLQICWGILLLQLVCLLLTASRLHLCRRL
mmetsp:Transcript_22421/g.59807  ORF Transcript_22421/g.59807 Transcript_22421/m.59807 type:complete len:288 (-) Transcript_22421:737-1600(-)